MKSSHLLAIAVFTSLQLFVASGAEFEPEAANHDVLSKALQALQKTEYRTLYDTNEKTSVYYRSIQHLGRVSTADGIRHLLLLHRIRSGNLETQSDTPPPRGSWHLAMFDADMKFINIQPTEETTRLIGNVLVIGESLRLDLSKAEGLRRIFPLTK